MEKFDELCAKYWVEGWQLFRPSGSPLTYDSCKAICMSEDTKFICSDFVEINSTKVSSLRFYCLQRDHVLEPPSRKPCGFHRHSPLRVFLAHVAYSLLRTSLSLSAALL